MDLYTTPLLTARDTARHLGMPESTLDRWLATPSDEPLVHAIKPERRGWPRVPFVGIIEAYVLRSLREAGLALSTVEAAAAAVRQEFGDPYALASQRIATDGVDIFVRFADGSLARAADGQQPIHEVIDGYLRFIGWDDEGTPRTLRLPAYSRGATVVIDPRFAWGAPVIEQSRTPVDEIVGLWRAGDRIDEIADEFGLAAHEVENVLRVAA